MSLKYDFFFKEKVASSEFELMDKFLKEKNIQYSKKINDNQIYFNVYEKLGFEIYIFMEDTHFFDYEINDTYLEYEWDNCTCISFDVNKFFDNQRVKSNMLEIVIAFLKSNAYDAVLLFNGDVLILDRKKGIVNANLESGFWKSKELLIKLENEIF
jgi:hypothetical protein